MDAIWRDTCELETLFGELSRRTSDHTKEKEISFDLFLNYLTNLYFGHQQHREFLLDLLSDVSTVDIAWSKLSLCWNFLDFSLLDHLVYKFNDPALSNSMEEYKTNIKAFRLRTRVCDFAEYFNFRRENLVHEGLKKIEARLKKKWEECTLQEFEDWRENITQKLLVPKFALVLQKLMINSGSVSVTWAIPAKFAALIASTMETLDMKGFSEEYSITSLKIDGKEYLRSLSPVMAKKDELDVAKKEALSSVLTEKEALSSVVTEKEALSSVVTEKEALSSVLTEKEALSSILTEKEAPSSVVAKKEALLSPVAVAKMQEGEVHCYIICMHYLLYHMHALLILL